MQVQNGLDMGHILHFNIPCSKIIIHISSTIKRKLVKASIESGMISVMLEKSTSLSNKSCLIIYLRAKPNGVPITFLLDLVELSSGTADGIL